MNNGQFNVIEGLLTRIAESLENQRPLIVAVPNDADAVQIMQELNSAQVQAARPETIEDWLQVPANVLDTRYERPSVTPVEPVKQRRGRPKKNEAG